MEDKTYKVDKMMDTLIELASNEVEKAKQRGYFGKDFVEAACEVIELEKKFGEEMYGYGNYDRRGGYGTPGYDTHRGYGNTRGYGDARGYGDGGYGNDSEENYGTGDYNRSGRKGERYGRSGERYG